MIVGGMAMVAGALGSIWVGNDSRSWIVWVSVLAFGGLGMGGLVARSILFVEKDRQLVGVSRHLLCIVAPWYLDESYGDSKRSVSRFKHGRRDGLITSMVIVLAVQLDVLTSDASGLQRLFAELTTVVPYVVMFGITIGCGLFVKSKLEDDVPPETPRTNV